MADQNPIIVFTGESEWCSLIARGLRLYGDLPVVTSAFDRASDALSARRWLLLASADVIVRVGMRPGARTLRGRGLDFGIHLMRAAHPGQQAVYYWIGTDVMNMLRDVRDDTAPYWLRHELSTSAHFSVSESLSDELREVDVSAEFMPFPFRGMPAHDMPPPLPKRFTVLTYIPEGRADFYGESDILAVARALPEVDFRVMGSPGAGDGTTLKNVEYLGRVEDPSPLFASASCVVRMTEHDGAGGTVLEALSYGRPTIYSRAQEGVIFVQFGDVKGLLREISQLKLAHDAGTLTVNEATAARTRAVYDPETCFRHMANRLRLIASSS